MAPAHFQMMPGIPEASCEAESFLKIFPSVLKRSTTSKQFHLSNFTHKTTESASPDQKRPSWQIDNGVIRTLVSSSEGEWYIYSPIKVITVRPSARRTLWLTWIHYLRIPDNNCTYSPKTFHFNRRCVLLTCKMALSNEYILCCVSQKKWSCSHLECNFSLMSPVAISVMFWVLLAVTITVNVTLGILTLLHRHILSFFSKEWRDPSSGTWHRLAVFH